MRFTDFFIKTLRESPKDEESVNARFLIQGGFINKLAAGIYIFLPLGLRVLNKIENIVREEMNAAGGVELLMPALHPKENWSKTGRWESFDALFKTKSKSASEYALGPTHEEIIYPLLTHFIFSYKDLPLALYQIQTKFRDEPRAKSG
ncbi:MAG: aminoacyl--tRNA ligase-related protein, partial [bacterium]|nr:aminoacyl--tRNA ligase-related protein [bacterium]